MDDLTIEDGAQVDTTETNAVHQQVLAGKYKSREDLFDATAELALKTGVKDKSYSELKSMGDSELEGYYKSLEHTFHSPRPAKQETVEVNQLDEVRPLLDAYAREAGLVSRTELEAEKREEENLNLYLTSNPSAKARVDKIKTLAQTDLFKGKSYAEIDNFLADSSGTKTSRPVKMGSNSKSEGYEGENSPEELSSFFLKR